MELSLHLFLCPFKKARRFLDCRFCILAALIAIYVVDRVVSQVPYSYIFQVKIAIRIHHNHIIKGNQLWLLKPYASWAIQFRLRVITKTGSRPLQACLVAAMTRDTLAAHR